MSVLNQLSVSLGQKDEAPNIALAQEIVRTQNVAGIQELVDNLADKKLQNDCIKVLYETGELDSKLIAPHLDTFLSLLSHKNNRLQWGAMTALNTLVPEKTSALFDQLPYIVAAADNGSVITKDYAVNILIQYCSLKTYSEQAFSLLNEQLLKCPTNQLPMYAERSVLAIPKEFQAVFRTTLHSRLAEMEKESKRKRVEKVIRKSEQTN